MREDNMDGALVGEVTALRRDSDLLDSVFPVLLTPGESIWVFFLLFHRLPYLQCDLRPQLPPSKKNSQDLW